MNAPGDACQPPRCDGTSARLSTHRKTSGRLGKPQIYHVLPYNVSNIALGIKPINVPLYRNFPESYQEAIAEYSKQEKNAYRDRMSYDAKENGEEYDEQRAERVERLKLMGALNSKMGSVSKMTDEAGTSDRPANQLLAAYCRACRPSSPWNNHIYDIFDTPYRLQN